MNTIFTLAIIFAFIVLGTCFALTIYFANKMCESYKKALTSLQKTIENNSNIITTVSLFIEALYNEKIGKENDNNVNS